MNRREPVPITKHETNRLITAAKVALIGGTVLVLAGCGVSRQAGAESSAPECQTLPTIVATPVSEGGIGHQLIGGAECNTPVYNPDDSDRLVGYIGPGSIFLMDCLEEGGGLRVGIIGLALSGQVVAPTGEDTFDIVLPPDQCQA